MTTSSPVDAHDCLSLYQYGETTPWTCPRCGQVWIVRDSRWVKVEAVQPTPQPSAYGSEVPTGWVEANARFSTALHYISSPTMGLPGGRDALDYVDEASEQNVREALKACIRTARIALTEPAQSDAPPRRS